MAHRMILHTYPDILRQLVLLTADYFDMRPSYVEKDYWVTLILSHLADSEYSEYVVFKGGTSLSKGYGLISRFSEDVDVAVIHETMTGNQLKTLIRNIEKSLVPDFEILDDPAASKGSMYRKSIFAYPSMVSDDGSPIASKRMILEISAFANPFPYETRQISSIIGDYLSKTNRQEAIDSYGLMPFQLNVLDYRRTLVEKIVSLARFSFAGEKALAGKIRHFYDLYYLMQTDRCQGYIVSDTFCKDVKELFAHDQQSFDAPEGWREKTIADSVLVSSFDSMWLLLQSKYVDEMSSLAFTPIPSADAVGEVVKNLFAKFGF